MLLLTFPIRLSKLPKKHLIYPPITRLPVNRTRFPLSFSTPQLPAPLYRHLVILLPVCFQPTFHQILEPAQSDPSLVPPSLTHRLPSSRHLSSMPMTFPRIRSILLPMIISPRTLCCLLLVNQQNLGIPATHLLLQSVHRSTPRQILKSEPRSLLVLR